MRVDRRRRLQQWLVVCAVVALAITAWDLIAGGFYFRVFGVRISSWEAYKPLRAGMLALVAALWLHDHDAAPGVAMWHRVPAIAPWVAGLAAIGSLAVAIRFGIHAAGGADGYGYVSQAYLWASGHLVIPNPLFAVTKDVGPAVAPLGYRLSHDHAWLLPIYSPGLPLMMAAALKLAGPAAIYGVVPLCGAVTVWCTFALGRRVAGTRVAVLATLLVACSPIVLFQSFQPMSDVPVTAFWMLAWVAAVSTSRWAPIGAGVATSIAIAIRPNLVPLAVAIAWVVGRDRPRVGRLATFAAAAIPGPLLIAIVNATLNGSPLESGYGSLDTLYAWGRIGPNVRNYATWLFDLHSPAIALAFIAPAVTRVREAWAMLVFTAILIASYLWYFVFDSWPFLRFLLPALPLLLILMSAVVVATIERLPQALRAAALLLVCTLLPGWYVATAEALTAFAIQRAEARYRAVGDAVAAHLEPNAVVLTVLHSGSIRLYSERMTVRWDLIEPANLDFTLEVLRAGGYVPYLVLDGFEEPIFQKRFARSLACTAIPIATFSDVATSRLYALPASVPPAESQTSPRCGSRKS